MSQDAQPDAPQAQPDAPPRLSVVVLQWDNLALTKRCVASLRAHTDVDAELIIVDNGSRADAEAYAREAADVAVCNGRNLGFAAGMNRGLEVAAGEIVAFVNNDTEFPPGWASPLLADFDELDDVGIVTPAVTACGNRLTVLEAPDDEVEVLVPYLQVPGGVIFLLRTEVARALGGYDESYRVASGEDLDLAYAVWTNGLQVVFDHRVLVEHESQATANAKLTDRRAIWDANREQFFRKWMDPHGPAQRLEGVDEAAYRRRRKEAAEAAGLRKLAQDRGAAAIDRRDELKRAERQQRRLRDRLGDRRRELADLERRLERVEEQLAWRERQLREARSLLAAEQSRETRLGRVARRLLSPRLRKAARRLLRR